MNRPDSRQRFSSRVDDYARHRPGYPRAVVEFVEQSLHLEPGARIADIGSGTGISSRLFLDQGYIVVGVEPNGPMRQAAERLLGDVDRFISHSGSAEATGLEAQSVDLVLAGQALHWFDVERARAEFLRITLPPHRAALFWNRRLTRGTPFLEAYETLLLTRGTDYRAVRHENVTAEVLGRFFGHADYAQNVIRHAVCHDFPGLCGRLLSSSYVPARDEPGHDEMMADLQNLFDTHAADGKVVINYETDIYTGRLCVTR